MEKVCKIGFFSILCFLVACSQPHYGGPQQEAGEAIEKRYTPAWTQVVYDTTYVPISEDIRVPIQTRREVNHPAKYAIVFKCQHGRFIIDGATAERLFGRFAESDPVTITYCMKFEIEKNGKTNIFGRHFLDAVKAE